MWRHGAPSTASSPRTALSEAAAEGAESEWEPLPAVELGSRITSLQWGKEEVVFIHRVFGHPRTRCGSKQSSMIS
jgi:hypothetical protein